MILIKLGSMVNALQKNNNKKNKFTFNVNMSYFTEQISEIIKTRYIYFISSIINFIFLVISINKLNLKGLRL